MVHFLPRPEATAQIIEITPSVNKRHLVQKEICNLSDPNHVPPGISSIIVPLNLYEGAASEQYIDIVSHYAERTQAAVLNPGSRSSFINSPHDFLLVESQPYSEEVSHFRESVLTACSDRGHAFRLEQVETQPRGILERSSLAETINDKVANMYRSENNTGYYRTSIRSERPLDLAENTYRHIANIIHSDSGEIVDSMSFEIQSPIDFESTESLYLPMLNANATGRYSSREFRRQFIPGHS